MLLLEPRYKLGRKRDDYHVAILRAAQGGHSGILKTLLEESDITFSSRRSRLHELILIEASHHGHVDIVVMMLDIGTNVDALDTRWDSSEPQQTSLYHAAARGQSHIAQLLLLRGAKTTIGTRQDPLHEAAKAGHKHVAQLLLDHGANIDAWWPGPLGVAAAHGQAHMVEFFLQRGADLGYEWNGWLSLTCAVDEGHASIVTMLVKNGLNVDGVREGHHPLIDAICRGHVQVAKALIGLGARRVDPLLSDQIAAHARYCTQGLRGSKVDEVYNERMTALQRLNASLTW